MDAAAAGSLPDVSQNPATPTAASRPAKPRRSVRKKSPKPVIASNGRNAAVLFVASPRLERKTFTTALPLAGNREISANLTYQTLLKLAEFSVMLDFDVIIASDREFNPHLALQHGAAFLLQRGRTFGGKLSGVIETVFAMGYEKIAVVANDCPTLSHRDFQKSFNFISETSIVLGPAKDGGVYLLGLPRALMELHIDLARLQWQAAALFPELVATFTGHNFDVLLLREKPDLDTLSDIANFINYFDSSDETSF